MSAANNPEPKYNAGTASESFTDVSTCVESPESVGFSGTLNQLVIQQQHMQKLLEEVHAQQAVQAANVASAVKQAVTQAFTRHNPSIDSTDNTGIVLPCSKPSSPPPIPSGNPPSFEGPSTKAMHEPVPSEFSGPSFCGVHVPEKCSKEENEVKEPTATQDMPLWKIKASKSDLENKSPRSRSRGSGKLYVPKTGTGNCSVTSSQDPGTELPPKDEIPDVECAFGATITSVGLQKKDPMTGLPVSNSSGTLWNACKVATKVKCKVSSVGHTVENATEIIASGAWESISSLHSKKATAELKRARMRIKKLLRSSKFEICVMMAILMNACVIAAQTDLSAKMLHDVQESDCQKCWTFWYMDIAFTGFFFIELILRIMVERRKFIIGKNRHWNCFDTLVIALAIVEETVGLNSNAKVLRILRTARLVRLVRFVRIMHFSIFHDLRSMVWGIIHSMLSLFWVLLLLTLIMFLFACVLTQSVTTAFLYDDMSSTITQEEKEDLRNNFGGLLLTMYSLFKAITGGDDWSLFADPLFKISPVAGLMFSAYISFTFFAVLNVVTAVFVERAMNSRASDIDLQIVHEAQNRERIQDAMNAIFEAADTDVSGTISWDEFNEHFAHPAVEAYFRQLGLDINRAGVQGLWELLDLDQNGQLQISELTAGADSLKGFASCLDLARVSHCQVTHSRQILSYVEETRRIQIGKFEALQRDVQRNFSVLTSLLQHYGISHPTDDKPSPTTPHTLDDKASPRTLVV